MANYQKAGVKLTNTQLNKLKYAAKCKTGTILWINKKNFHEVFAIWRRIAICIISNNKTNN